MATGAPLPAARYTHSGKSSTPYPCSDHPCGCLSSEQCWAGDCCCFTLEQKLSWAEARGIEAPAHAQLAVKARAAKVKPAKPKRPCCRGEEEGVATANPCDKPVCHERPHDATSHDADEPTEIRWVSSVFQQKCRGEGPAGLLKLDPTVPPPLGTEHTAPEPRGFVAVASLPIPTTSACPPTRPPRHV
jgi:hypothetical protein